MSWKVSLPILWVLLLSSVARAESDLVANVTIPLEVNITDVSVSRPESNILWPIVNQTLDAFSFLVGFHIVEAAVQLVRSTNELKRISIDFAVEFRQILERNGQEYNAQVRRIVEHGVVKAQKIVNPIVQSMRSILGVVPGAQSIAGVSNVISIIENIVTRLETQIFTANEELQELFIDILMSLQQISVEVGSKLIQEIEALISKSVTNVKRACIPLIDIFVTPTQNMINLGLLRTLLPESRR